MKIKNIMSFVLLLSCMNICAMEGCLVLGKSEQEKRNIFFTECDEERLLKEESERQKKFEDFEKGLKEKESERQKENELRKEELLKRESEKWKELSFDSEDQKKQYFNKVCCPIQLKNQRQQQFLYQLLFQDQLSVQEYNRIINMLSLHEQKMVSTQGRLAEREYSWVMDILSQQEGKQLINQEELRQLKFQITIGMLTGTTTESTHQEGVDRILGLPEIMIDFRKDKK